MIAPSLLLLLSAVQAPAPSIDSLLVIGRTSPGRRSPVVIDAVEARLARGTLGQPEQGQTLERAGGEPLVWRSIEPGENGWFSDSALRGGWALATVEVPEDGVWILDASGHRRLEVNGEPRAGDVYALGLTKLPIALKAGSNQLLFKGGRGRLRAKLVEAPSGPYLAGHDRVLPHVLGHLAGKQMVAGLRVGNPSVEWAEVGFEGDTETFSIAPLSVRSIPFRFMVPEALEPESLVDGRLLVLARLRSGDQMELNLTVKSRHEPHKRTFVSEVDGSVQYYAVTPPPEESAEEPVGFVLSLHGASVQATNQAFSYTPKDDLVIVAPTNRRPFGFDWEDWGRYDALEVYAHADQEWRTDPLRQYLTGHSMGGHGTWNLGAHLDGKFAAIAPSAGWRDFWAYGASEETDPSEVMGLLGEAANGSRTLLLKENYADQGIYVLHGDADETVSVEQARFMRDVLAQFHPNFAYYERAGAGHWWGNECMDWPPLFDFLRQNRLPEPQDRLEVNFTTINPAVHAGDGWVTIHAQQQSMLPSQVEARVDPAESSVRLETRNVSVLTLDFDALFELIPKEHEPGFLIQRVMDSTRPVSIEIDGQSITLDHDLEGPTVVDDLEPRRPEEDVSDGVIALRRSGDVWEPTDLKGDTGKSPERAGPFKDAFRHRFVYVVGTAGDDERDALLLQKARYDAEEFGYRGNGSIEIVLDVDFAPDAPAFEGRSVVLVGNADDNGAWNSLLADSPIQVRDGAIRAGDREESGADLVCLVVRPHPSDGRAAVAAIAPTGDVGARMSVALPYFVSGVGYPDWTVLGTEMLEQGAAGIRGAGFFGPDWSLESGRSAWR